MEKEFLKETEDIKEVFSIAKNMLEEKKLTELILFQKNTGKNTKI